KEHFRDQIEKMTPLFILQMFRWVRHGGSLLYEKRGRSPPGVGCCLPGRGALFAFSCQTGVAAALAAPPPLPHPRATDTGPARFQGKIRGPEDRPWVRRPPPRENEPRPC